MSNEAMTWALRDAPDVPSHAVAVLIGLANHANELGQGAFPSQKLLGKYARKLERQVRKDLSALEEMGLIRRGDQRLVAHIPADRRPIVWDLAMELTASQTGGPTGPAGPRRPVVEDRGVPDGRSCGTQREVPQDRLTVREPTTTAEVGSTGVGGSRKREAATPRGTRIPDEFTITAEMRAWGMEKFPHFDGESETEAFIDYWKSVAGAKGLKADWVATWKTWIRREAKSQAARNSSPSRAVALNGHRPSTTDQRVADVSAAAARVKAQIYGSQT